MRPVSRVPAQDDTTPPRPLTRRYYRSSTGPRDLREGLPHSRGGRAWRPEDGSRLPARVPVWSCADRWLDALSAALRTPEGEKLRAAARVGVGTVLDVAAVEARTADSRTGRGVSTAHATVAQVLGCSAKTVQRARCLMEALGYARTVVAGRYLSAQERADATAHHGGHQRRMASQRVLLVPRPAPNVHLPRRGAVGSYLLSRSGLPKHARAAARQPSTTKKQGPPRPSLSVQRLAARIAQRLPWLARGHIGSLCRTLTVLGLDDTGWTAQDVLDLLERRNTALGRHSLPPDAQRDPLALFAHQVRAALLDVEEPPRLRRGREAFALAAERARARAQRVAEEAHLAAERTDPVVQARITATKQRIRDQLAAARAHARYRRSCDPPSGGHPAGGVHSLGCGPEAPTGSPGVTFAGARGG